MSMMMTTMGGMMGHASNTSAMTVGGGMGRASNNDETQQLNNDLNVSEQADNHVNE
jgi:hypothetical protein